MNDKELRMAVECQLLNAGNREGLFADALKKFADLIRAEATEQANARANTSWALMCKKMVEAEREAIEDRVKALDEPMTVRLNVINNAIRARGNT